MPARQVGQRPHVDQPRRLAIEGKGLSLGRPVRDVAHSAVQDVDQRVRRVGRRQQVRRLLEHPAEPLSARGADEGQVGIRPGRVGGLRVGGLQPRPDPPQIRGHLLSLTGSPGGEQMLDQMLSQVPGRPGQLPPRRHDAAADRGRRGGWQVLRCGVQQHLVQLGQPGAAEFVAQEVPDDVVHGDGSVVAAGHSREQGEVGQPGAQRHRGQLVGGLPQRRDQRDRDGLVFGEDRQLCEPVMVGRAQPAGAGLDRGPDGPLPLVRIADIELLTRCLRQLVDL